MASFSFNSGNTTGGTLPDAVDISALDTAAVLGAGQGTTFSPFSTFAFTGTLPNLVRFGIAESNFANNTVTFTTAVGIRTSAGSSNAGGSSNTTTMTAVPATPFNITASATHYYWGTPADIQAFIQGIRVTVLEGTATNLTSSLTVRFAAFGGASNLNGTTIGIQQGSAISVPPITITPCYVRGTRIAVPGGQVAVEALRIGDAVLTADGAAKPVKWIGRGFHATAAVAATPSLRPVLIRAGALADGVPARDLMVSPMHGMVIDEVIVPAAALVNGGSIVRVAADAGVDYFHIEMDAHEVILAEGARGETFIDADSRAMFDNADEYAALFGETAAPAPVAPRVEEGYLLEAIHRRLAGRRAPAEARGALRGLVERVQDGLLEGWASDTAGPVELEVLVEGEIVTRVIANRFRTDLDDAGIAGGRAGFTVQLPAAVDSLMQVKVRRAADGEMLHVHQAVPAHA